LVKPARIVRFQTNIFIKLEMMRIVLLSLLIGSCAAAETQANPIRKVVTLMQNMQKEIETEGAKEKELLEKFLCYCSGGTDGLKKAIADANAEAEELTAKAKSEAAEKSQLTQDLLTHKKDREGAKADMEEATMLRGKEEAAYSAEKADSETNIAAMASAIPALEKGMGGAALLQMPSGDRIKKLVQSYPNVDVSDRREALAFLEDSSTGASDQIVGILKAMKDDMEAELKEAIADEEKSVAGYNDLKASKEKEVEMATEAIETKMARQGELAVSLVQTKDALEDAIEESADSSKFLATLEKDCGTKEKEMAERTALRNQEIAAISEAISILNDDDALDVFKKSMPSSFVQAPGFLQKDGSKASRAQKAQTLLAVVAGKAKDVHLNLLLYTASSKLKMKAAAFEEVKKMIDDMVVLLGKQQADDEKQKAYCETEFDTAADEEAAAKTKLSQTDAKLAELTDTIGTLMEEISALEASIAALDKSVADATEQRKEEHASYVEQMQMNEAAMGLVKKAQQRMQKFYNPTLYKAPPKTENTMEEKIIIAGTFAQVHMHEHVAPPPAPEMPSGPLQKNAKSAGVIGMMDTIIKDLADDMKDMEYEEKTASKDYAELMADSQETRAGDAKALTGKQSTKAEKEDELMTTKEIRSATATDLKQVQTVIQDLHAACDFIMQNFDLRKEARTNEIEGLKNAKAVLSGANFS
jgi:predicted  nucleic acid-binding Zn-ribbon protein